jgi:hypothetical protein
MTFCPVLWGTHTFRATDFSVFMRYTQHFIECTSKSLFVVPTDAHYYKIIEMLKQFTNYNICSDMFRFTQEPSSGSSAVLS